MIPNIDIKNNQIQEKPQINNLQENDAIPQINNPSIISQDINNEINNEIKQNVNQFLNMPINSIKLFYSIYFNI